LTHVRPNNNASQMHLIFLYLGHAGFPHVNNQPNSKISSW